MNTCLVRQVIVLVKKNMSMFKLKFKALKWKTVRYKSEDNLLLVANEEQLDWCQTKKNLPFIGMKSR